MEQTAFIITGTKTYSEVTECASSLRSTEEPKLIDTIWKLLQRLAHEDQVSKAQLILHGINEAALRLSALNGAWIEFSNQVFEQILLPSKTITTSVFKTLYTLFEERTNQNDQ